MLLGRAKRPFSGSMRGMATVIFEFRKRFVTRVSTKSGRLFNLGAKSSAIVPAASFCPRLLPGNRKPGAETIESCG
ncbi:hypothetical protein KC335_g149 [Hortaea werneckii]|nr:hypothetical protein KC335_g149 [Hortaea werneckii]